jgi:hypothetical protein
MSVRNTLILNHSDLKYLLIDSLRLYSDNVVFIDGNNPYRFSINKKTFYVLPIIATAIIKPLQS